jgi:hypothetical protein
MIYSLIDAFCKIIFTINKILFGWYVRINIFVYLFHR